MLVIKELTLTTNKKKHSYCGNFVLIFPKGNESSSR